LYFIAAAYTVDVIGTVTTKLNQS